MALSCTPLNLVQLHFIRDGSLITGCGGGGGGGLQNRKIADPNHFGSPLQDRVKIVASPPPLLKVGNLVCPPPPPPQSVWLKFQAPVLKLPQNLCPPPPPPPFSMAKTISVPPPFVGVKFHCPPPPPPTLPICSTAPSP